eukprot:8772860-Pyramimonas_sp.AAC.1
MPRAREGRWPRDVRRERLDVLGVVRQRRWLGSVRRPRAVTRGESERASWQHHRSEPLGSNSRNATPGVRERAWSERSTTVKNAESAMCAQRWRRNVRQGRASTHARLTGGTRTRQGS